MPMNKRTGTIRLKELQDRYYDRLQDIAYEVYDEQLHNLIIKPEELDTDIRQYFRHTLPFCKNFIQGMPVSGSIFMKRMKLQIQSFYVFWRIALIHFL